SIVRQGAVTVAGTSEPGATLTVNDTVVEIETNGSFTHLAVIKLGARTITVVATDLAGNSTTETRKVTFDPDVTDYNAPVIELVSPRPQATVTTATPVISFRVGDDFAGVDSNSLKVIIDGTDFIPQISVLDDLTMEGTYTVIVNLSEGEHTLKLTAADTLGNQAQPVETTFTVATKAPETMLWLDWNENDSDTVTLHLLSKLAIDPSDYLLNIYTEEFDTAISATSIKFPPDAPFSKQDLDQFIADNEWEGVRDYPWGEYYTTTFTLNNEILNRKILLQLYDNSTLLDSAVLGTVLVYDDRLQTFTTDDGTTLVFQENSFHDQSTGNDITTDLSFFSWTEERQNDRTEELKTAARASQGLVKIAKGYEMQFAGLPVGVTAVTLTPEVAVRLPYTKNQSGTVTALDGVTEVNSNQLGVFIWNDTTNRYDFGGSNLLTVSTDSGTVTLAEGTFDKLGTFELLADTVNPTITLFPDPGETLDSGEELHFDVSEKGCPINTQSILLQVNNLNSIHFYKTIDDMNGEIFYVPAGPHSGATVTITLTVPDSCSNSAQFSRSFLLREAFGIRYTLPYPNPVRTNNITIRYVLTQEADDVIIEIYDLNGDLMEELNGGTAATFNEVVWNLTDYGGTPVPNGSYIYRVMATRLQETFKTTGKLSILR
ncbi:MAG: FlgD immunoglobulin-like domain containing protein, partial [bacterium]|nr:FlgD immunoglobulin-like domain containing protein [bacterium]